MTSINPSWVSMLYLNHIFMSVEYYRWKLKSFVLTAVEQEEFHLPENKVWKRLKLETWETFKSFSSDFCNMQIWYLRRQLKHLLAVFLAQVSIFNDTHWSFAFPKQRDIFQHRYFQNFLSFPLQCCELLFTLCDSKGAFFFSKSQP